MMSSSELQRISLSATKSVRAEGVIEADPLNESVTLNDDNDDDDDEDDERDSKSISTIGMKDEHMKIVENLTNGGDVSPSKANVTITSSIGDITVDSVRDHLNSTVTTLHTTTTEEIVGMYEREREGEKISRHLRKRRLRLPIAIFLRISSSFLSKLNFVLIFQFVCVFIRTLICSEYTDKQLCIIDTNERCARH